MRELDEKPHLELIPQRWLEWEPRGNCHEPISASLATIGLATAAEAGVGAVGSALAAGVGTAGFGGTALGLASGTALAGTSAGILGTGIGLGELGTIASVGGSLLSAKSQMDQADYQQAAYKNQAEALRQKGNQDAALAERAAITQNRRTDLALSRTRALAASSGAAATSPDVLNTEGQIAQQGGYNALSALYEGQAAQRSDNYQADIDLFNAKRVSSAVPLQVGGTLLSGISSFADRKIRRDYLLNAYGGAY